MPTLRILSGRGDQGPGPHKGQCELWDQPKGSLSAQGCAPGSRVKLASCG